MSDRTRPDEKTRKAGEADAKARHAPDRPPTADEEAAAPDEADDSTRAAYQEMTETGADAKGEGRVP
jgi:hypothetical protein